MRWWQFRSRDAELTRELESDLELEEEEQRQRGIPAEEAGYAARRAFGNIAAIAEQTRETWGWAPVARFWQDVRFAGRQIARNRKFAIVCIVTLALGIGAQSTIYSVIHAVLIDPYPYHGAMRMVHLHLYDKDPAPDDLALNGPQFAEFEKSPVLEGAIAEDVYTMSLSGGEMPEQLSVGRMSPNAFDYFGVPALLGRGFKTADGNRVAVLSYAFWNSHYAARTDVLGNAVRLNGENYTIIGVLPRRFAWMWGDVYVPLAYSTDPRRIANIYARLREGVSDRAAEQALQPMLDRFAKETPANFPQHFKVHLVHINEVAIGRLRGVLTGLFISVSFLLALACVNVAILMLARGEMRQGEIGIRKALGADRRRVFGQLLTESVFLSSLGGGLGVLLAFAGVRAVLLLTQPLPTFFPAEANVAVNVPVLLFSVAVSMVTGVLCGMWPALRISRTDLRQVIHSTGNRLAGRRGMRSAQIVLLTMQIAATILLLVCSATALRGLYQLVHMRLGYDPENLASVKLVLPEGAHNEWADRVHYFELVRSAIAADSGVISAAIGVLPPNGVDSTPVSVPGQQGASGSAIAQGVSQDYFPTMRIPILSGRLWSRDEVAHGNRFALINETFRRRYWPTANPIGATVVLNNGVANGTYWKLVAPGDDQHFQVIGVVGDTPNRGLNEDTAPAVYVPYSMTPYDGFAVVFRARGNPGGLLHSIKERVRGIEKDQALGELITANDMLEGDSVGQERFVASLFGAFAFLALAFAVSGLYAIQSYLVAQRKRELGVRIALGASRIHIVKEVTRSCSLSVLIGAGTGIIADLLGSRVIAHWTGGNTRDPGMLFIVVVVLLIAAGAASVGPVLSAASIDTMRVLRSD